MKKEKYTLPKIILILAIALGAIAPFSACGRGPSPEARVKFQNAMKFYNQKRLEKAESLLREVLLEDGNFLEAHLMLGRLYFYKKNHELAEIAFKEAAGLDTANLTARFYLARIYYLDSRRHHEALKLLDYILEKNSGFTQAWRLKGAIHENRGDTQKAIAAYNYAVTENKKMARVHRRLSKLYSQALLPEQSKTSLQIARCLSAGDKKLRVNF